MELILLYTYENKYNEIIADRTACILKVPGSNVERDAG